MFPSARWTKSLVLAVAIAGLSQRALALDPTAELADPDEVTTLVHAAARLVELTGERAFEEFHTPDTRWLHGNTSIYVADLEGRTIVDPSRPDAEGADEFKLRDMNGRPVTASIIAAATGAKHSGWAHFLAAPEPGAEPAWRSTYATQITDPSGDKFVVAAGFFGAVSSRYFVHDTVDRAAAELLARGDEVLTSINNKHGLYSYDTTSVFVFNQEGTLLADAQSPKVVGQNLFEIPDATGVPVANRIVHAMDRGDRTWIDYQAPHGDDGEFAHRTVYIRKVEIEDQTLYVAAGLFVQDR